MDHRTSKKRKHGSLPSMASMDRTLGKRRRVPNPWNGTVFETFFPGRDRILDEGLNRFYYQSRLPQEGAFYKYGASSFVYSIVLFLKLLKVKNGDMHASSESPKNNLEPILVSEQDDEPVPVESSQLGSEHWDHNEARLDFFTCTLLAIDQLETEHAYIPRLCQKEYDMDHVKRYKNSVKMTLGSEFPQSSCSIWNLLFNFLVRINHDHPLRFAIHHVYFEVIIHAKCEDLPHDDSVCCELASMIIEYASEHINSISYLKSQINLNMFMFSSMGHRQYRPMLRELIGNCLSRSQQSAKSELDSIEEMAFMYRRVINTVFSGEHDFIHVPLEHRHLFRCFASFRYPSLFEDKDRLHKVTGVVLHHLGMTVVPDHNNPSILYFNPESRNYWKEASKVPCNHVESMTKMGKYYLDRQQYDTAYNYILQAADQNYSDALTEMATMYRKGWGPCEQDNSKAVECYLRAIENDDDGFAHVSLGYMYERGFGVDADLQAAFNHYQIASSKGQEYGSAKMGLFYQTGNRVVEQDWRESLRCFLLAKEQNYENADHHIADLMGMIRSATVLGNV